MMIRAVAREGHVFWMLEQERFHHGRGLFITCCGNRVLYAESSKLGKLPPKY